MKNMMGIFQFDTPFLVSFLILSVMSCLSLVFSLSFRLKSRVVGKLPKNLPVNVFDKTFNVFNPYPSRRKMIHSYIILLPILAWSGSLIVAFIVTVKIFEMGLILGLTLLLISLGLMMIEEALEIYRNANIFVKAVKNGVNLGKGDLAVLFLVKETLPKLSAYYLLLAVVFFTSSIALPYIVPAFLLTFAQFAGVVVEISASTGLLAVYLTAFLYALVILIVHVAAREIKSKVFDFPPSEEITILLEGVPRCVPLDI